MAKNSQKRDFTFSSFLLNLTSLPPTPAHPAHSLLQGLSYEFLKTSLPAVSTRSEKDNNGLLNVGFNATLDVQCTISPKTAVGIYFEVVTPGGTPFQPDSRGLIHKRTPTPDSASPNLLHEGCQTINKRRHPYIHGQRGQWLPPRLQQRKNPNGCTSQMSYYTSLRPLNQLLQRHLSPSTVEYNYEIAAHHDTRRYVAQRVRDQPRNEVAGNLIAINQLSGIPYAQIQGFRAPFLHYSVNTLRMLKQMIFEYDTSATSSVPVTDPVVPLALTSLKLARHKQDGRPWDTLRLCHISSRSTHLLAFEKDSLLR
ncbi:hypothetical protein V8E36_001619 [Tilletia maclaganii]